MTRCDTCGAEYSVGYWPWCPHGKPALAVVDDTMPGHWCDTLGHDDVWIESKSQLRLEAEKRNLVNVVRHEDSYYARQRKQRDEMYADTRQR